MYAIYFTTQAKKDSQKFKFSALRNKIEELLQILREDPYQYPPGFERLTGNLSGFISRRINRQHRLVYQVYEEKKAVKILSMWTHYE